MAWDETCLIHAEEIQSPILRFYDWSEPTATFGYFQKYHEATQLTPLRPLIRRPTGGGLVPHTNDWTYSLIFPPSAPWYRNRAMESYVQLHEWLQMAFRAVGIITHIAPAQNPEGPGRCFVGTEKHDLVLAGSKVAGAAQKRNRTGFLVQGSIQPPPTTVTRAQWGQALRATAAGAWNVRWQPWSPPPTYSHQAEDLAHNKYRDSTYNEQR
ncbi:MAG: Octanoyltransferase LipM [Verrucomicrobia subdivision 3 bacterium]|nr:Octanoyltransferase LipM [Limisphaerales bacterium]MCS1414871.1 Octanoyltransferase LipM [Limisphaerales bacterium]